MIKPHTAPQGHPHKKPHSNTGKCMGQKLRPAPKHMEYRGQQQAQSQTQRRKYQFLGRFDSCHFSSTILSFSNFCKGVLDTKIRQSGAASWQPCLTGCFLFKTATPKNRGSRSLAEYPENESSSSFTHLHGGKFIPTQYTEK